MCECICYIRNTLAKCHEINNTHRDSWCIFICQIDTCTLCCGDGADIDKLNDHTVCIKNLHSNRLPPCSDAVREFDAAVSRMHINVIDLLLTIYRNTLK